MQSSVTSSDRRASCWSTTTNTMLGARRLRSWAASARSSARRRTAAPRSKRVRLLHPDVVVLDISMPGMTGFEVAARLRESGEPAAVVFLTVHDEESMMLAAMDAGAHRLRRQGALVTDLPIAVREARQGRRFVSRL